MNAIQDSYDVALTFAGEDRPYVEQVAEILKQSQVKVFYDKDEEVELWGKDLADTLDEIYRIRSTFVVIFISEHYGRSVWTNHERKSALARAMQQREEFVLPARFDDTVLPGLRPTTAYIDLRRETPESFASKILHKILDTRRVDQVVSSAEIQAPSTTPGDLEDVAGYLILGLTSQEHLVFWKLFADEPPARGDDSADSEYEDIFFDDFNEMAEVFASIRNASVKADQAQREGFDRQKAFERAWMDECINRASFYAMSKIGKENPAKQGKLDGVRYIIFGIHHNYAPMIHALRTQEFLENRLKPSRDAEEVYFDNVSATLQIPSALQRAQDGSKGDGQEFMRLLFVEAMRFRTFGTDVGQN